MLKHSAFVLNNRQRGTVAVGCGIPMYAMLRAHPKLWRTSRLGCIALNEEETECWSSTESLIQFLLFNNVFT